MKKILLATIPLMLTIVACKNTEENVSKDEVHEVEVKLEVCDCIVPSEENKTKCTELFPEISNADIALCGGDTIVADTLSQVQIDSVRADYENDLSLEIKEIEEEKENPISEECKLFLEDYAASIKSFASLTEKIAADPDDIGLQIQMSSASEDINGWASKPQMFQCSQNEAFQKQIEILNEKRDKLLAV